MHVLPYLMTIATEDVGVAIRHINRNWGLLSLLATFISVGFGVLTLILMASKGDIPKTKIVMFGVGAALVALFFGYSAFSENTSNQKLLSEIRENLQKHYLIYEEGVPVPEGVTPAMTLSAAQMEFLVDRRRDVQVLYEVNGRDYFHLLRLVTVDGRDSHNLLNEHDAKNIPGDKVMSLQAEDRSSSESSWVIYDPSNPPTSPEVTQAGVSHHVLDVLPDHNSMDGLTFEEQLAKLRSIKSKIIESQSYLNSAERELDLGVKSLEGQSMTSSVVE